MNTKEFFDKNYSTAEHYWWKNINRFSTEETEHTPYYAQVLKFAKETGKGRVLDLGAGEGIDAIRLAKLGFDVDAVEFSNVAVRKIKKFAESNKVQVNAICADICEFNFEYTYDIIMLNGVLHYINPFLRLDIINKIQEYTKIGGINCISLFSTETPVPECHNVVPVYPEKEGGQIEQCYVEWETLYKCYDRQKPETSHLEMQPHAHSFIKFISRRIL